jgi:hypothetical protein
MEVGFLVCWSRTMIWRGIVSHHEIVVLNTMRAVVEAVVSKCPK